MTQADFSLHCTLQKKPSPHAADVPESPTLQGDWIDQMLATIPVPSYSTTTVLSVLVGIAALVAAWLIWSELTDAWARRRPRGPYKAKSILTPNEIEFFNRLVSALPGYVVLSQVAMSALIEPRTQDPKEYMRRRVKFAQKYVDFVVCEPGDLRVIAIVELDDITHDAAKDALRDEMVEGAGYTVVRWHSRRKPNRADIARTIRKLDQRKA